MPPSRDRNLRPARRGRWGSWNQPAVLLPFSYVERDPARRRAGADDPARPGARRGPRRDARPDRRADPGRRRRHRPELLRRRGAPRDDAARSPSATGSRSRSPAARSSATCRCSASAAACRCSTSPSAARCSSTCPRRSATSDHRRTPRQLRRLRSRRPARRRLARGARRRRGAARDQVPPPPGRRRDRRRPDRHRHLDARRAPRGDRAARTSRSCSASSGTPRPTRAAA